MITISIIIPTYNRAAILPLCLDSLSKQAHISPQHFEIIVVDNNSKDHTKELIEQYIASFPSLSIKYLLEHRQGLHWARHAGARAAQGDILAFTDDDAAVTPEWLTELSSAYGDPGVGAAGGPIHVRWLTAPPFWAADLDIFGYLDYGENALELSWPQQIHGGNFSIRRNVLFEVGGFNPDTAVEDRLVGDGEVGLCQKLYAAGWKIVYAPRALVFHMQNGASSTLDTIQHRYAQQGRCQAYTDYRTHRYPFHQLLCLSAFKLYQEIYEELRAVKYAGKDERVYYRSKVRAATFLAEAKYYRRLAFQRHFRRIVLRNDWINESAN